MFVKDLFWREKTVTRWEKPQPDPIPPPDFTSPYSKGSRNISARISLSYCKTASLMGPQLVILLIFLGAGVSAWRFQLQWVRPMAAAISGVAIGMAPMAPLHTMPCYADSTGKLSTKLTAKRRYLPRIQSGVKSFNSVKSFDDFLGFEKNDFPPFQRALGLYGASLRRGELPDEISREAEAKTEAVGRAVQRLKSSGKDAFDSGMKEVRAAMDEYLSFAKLPLSSSSEDYK